MCKNFVFLISCVLVLSLFLPSVANAGLVAWYEFEGNCNDSSGNSLDGTANGGPTYAPGVYGQAIVLDGTDDYVDIGYSPTLSLNEFTVSAWVNIAPEPGIFGVHGTRAGADFTFDLKVEATQVHGSIGNGSAWLSLAWRQCNRNCGPIGSP